MQDPTLADELGDDLMDIGINFFTNNCFKEASEYFTEVIRLVCEFNFVRDAYVYQAKCYLKLVSSITCSYSEIVLLSNQSALRRKQKTRTFSTNS